MIRRLALALVRRYPRAWRERYEAEVAALIDDSPARVRDLGELARGLVTERAREIIASDDRPQRTAAVLTWMPVLFIGLLTALAAGLGLALRDLTGPWTSSQQEAGGLVIAAVVTIVMVIWVVYPRRRWQREPRPPIPAWIAAVVFPAFFGMVLCMVWGDLLFTYDTHGMPGWLVNGLRVYFVLSLGFHLTSSLWPGRRMLRELGMLAGAEGQIQANETWVRSCHEWMAQGVPSPLAEAEAQVAHWTRVRDEARERLRALGYRARFQARHEE